MAQRSAGTTREVLMSGAHVVTAAPTVAVALFAVIAWLRPDLLETRAGSLALWGMTALAISSAMLAAGRATFLPMWARLALGVIGMYAFAAMTLALREGTEYLAWLSGDGVWRALPYVLRGAFVGLFVLVPTAIVLQTLKTGVRRWRGAAAWREANRAVALALCVAIVAVHLPAAGPTNESMAGQLVDRPSRSSPAPLKLPSLALPEPSTLNPEEFLTRADETAARVAPLDWDFEAKADSLGAGVELAFAFVRDEVRYEAYSGVFRGAAGTYRNRAGNAADRAILLKRLLERKGLPARFALGSLPEAPRERLFQRIFVSDPAGSRLAQRLETLPNGTTFPERLVRRAKRDYDVVRTALGDRLPVVTKPSRQEVIAEMNPHVWIQTQEDGKWIDLDPLFPDSAVGITPATFERWVAELPPDFFQRVRVHLYAEHYSGASLLPTTLIDVTRNAVDLIDSQIFVVHTSTDPGNPMGGLGAVLANRFGRRASVWTPILSIDGEFMQGATVDILASGPVFVAEWLEFELLWPDGRREVTRRPLVDRAGAAWRASLPLDVSSLDSLDGDDNGAFAMQALHNVWFTAGKHNLADFSSGMRYVAATAVLEQSATTEAQSAVNESFPANAFPFALQNLAWMVWTDHVVIPSLNGSPGLRLYGDSPRIAIFTFAPGPQGTLETGSDLRRDSLRGLAAEATHQQALSERKLWFAMLQGSLEQEALAEFVASAEGDPASVQTTSSSLSTDGVAVLYGSTALGSLPRSPHPESRARLSRALGAGKLVVAPLAGLDQRCAWWEIAHGTADTQPLSGPGLNGARGRFKPPNPMKTRVTGQTNSYGGPKAYEIDQRTLSSRAQTTRAETRAIARTQRRASEYAVQVLLIALSAAAVAALVYVGVKIALSIYSSAEQISAPQ